MPPFDSAHDNVQARKTEQAENQSGAVHFEAYELKSVQPKGGAKDSTAEKFLPSVDLVEKSPENAKVSPQATEAAAKAINEACSGIGTDEDKIFAVLNGMHSEAERKALVAVYKQKYGIDLASELKSELSGQELDKSLNLLNKKDDVAGDDRASRIHETLIERNQTFEGRSDENCEKDIRDTLSTMNSKELAELDKVYRERYGVSLRDALMNDSGLSSETKAAAEIYLQGSDKRTSEMSLKIADIALQSQNLEMFEEAMSRATPEARAQFLKNNGEQKMHDAFGSSTEFEHAKNYATEGQLSTTSKIEANTGRFNDNEEAIEKSISEMSDKERAEYLHGRDLAAGKDVAGLTDAEKQQALATYKNIHESLTEAGNDKEIKHWEDLISVKGGSLTSNLAAHEGTIYDDSVNAVITDVENMSKSDWERLKNDPNYRSELESSLGYLSDEDKAKVLAAIDEKQNSKTYEEAQGKRRSAEEVLTESAGFFNDDEESIYTAIEKMSPEEQKRYREDAEYRKQIDAKLTSSLDEGAEQDAAKSMLKQIMEGKTPERDIVAKLNIHASSTDTDEAEVVRDIEEAFAKDPGLRDRINNPQTDEDRELSAQFNKALHRAFDSDEYELYAKPLLADGHLSMELKNKLNTGLFNDDEQGAYKDLTALASRKDDASIAERNRILNDAAYQEKVLGLLSDDEKAVALNALIQGEMRPEDQIRSHMLGAGTDEEEIKEVLSKLTPEEKLEVARLYAIKYGSDLSADFVDELGGQDAKDVKRELQQPAKNAQEAFDRARDEYYESRDGIGSTIVDSAWDGTGYMSDASLSNYRAAMSKASAEFRQLSPEEQKTLSDNLKESVDAFVKSKGAAADAIVDGVVIAAGVAGSAFTGGLSLALLAQTAVAGALFKLAVKPAVIGADYDWSSSQVFVDGLTGAIDAASIVVGPAQLAQVFKLGEKCAATTAGKLLEEGSEQLLKSSMKGQAEKKIFETVAHALSNGEGAITDKAISKLAKELAVDGVAAEQLEVLLKQNLKECMEKEARTYLQHTAEEISLNAASGAFGGGASGVIRSSVEWDSSKTVAENLQMIGVQTAMGAMSGVIGAGGMTVAGRLAGKTFGKATADASSKVEVSSGTLGASGAVLPNYHQFDMEFHNGDTSVSPHVKLVSDADVANESYGVENALTWNFNNNDFKWKTTAESLKIRKDAQNFVSHIMNQDYVQAINARLQTSAMRQGDMKLNFHSKTASPKDMGLLNPSVDVCRTGAELSDAANLPEIMQKMSSMAKFKWGEMTDSSKVTEDCFNVVIPRVVVNTSEGGVPVALFDFQPTANGYEMVFPTTQINGKPLTPGQLAEINALRQSTNGKRIVSETAVLAFEETFHAQQYLNGSKIISPSLASHMKNSGLELPMEKVDTRKLVAAFSSNFSSFSDYRSHLYEVEIPAVLFDAGLPYSMVERHYFFGDRHVKARNSIMKYLRERAGGTLEYKRSLAD